MRIDLFADLPICSAAGLGCSNGKCKSTMKRQIEGPTQSNLCSAAKQQCHKVEAKHLKPLSGIV